MCIIIVKPYSKKGFKKAYLEEAWRINSDGFGMAISREEDVLIVKGMMEKEEMLEAVNKYTKEYPKSAMILHFRNHTTGSVCAENCHPYPISNKIKDLKAIEISAEYAFAHNGIIYSASTSKRDKGLDLTDTQEYIMDYIYGVKNYLSDDNFRKLWAYHSHGKFAILAKQNAYYMIGVFEKERGLYYSNKSYMPTTTTPFYSSNILVTPYSATVPYIQNIQTQEGIDYLNNFATCSVCQRRFSRHFIRKTVDGKDICIYCEKKNNTPEISVYNYCAGCGNWFPTTDMSLISTDTYLCKMCQDAVY